MTERDMLLERLERINPVPDPGALYEDLQIEPPRVGVPAGGANSLRLRKPLMRRGALAAAVAAALVILVGAAIGTFAINPGDPAGGNARLLQLTIDGDSCVYEGPRALTAGEAEIEYRNVSSESRWANILRLDADRTTTEVFDAIADDPRSGAPTWSSPVWLNLDVSAGGTSVSRVVSLEPGTHILLCGDAARGAVFGADVVVTD